MPSADGSTLALMSSLSAPASGTPCGTGIIRMADEKVFSSKRAGKGGQEHKVELTVSRCPWRVTTQQEGTSIKIKKRKKEKDLVKISIYASPGQLLDSLSFWLGCPVTNRCTLQIFLQ